MNTRLIWFVLGLSCISCAAESWIEQSDREAAAANDTCKAKQYAECRVHVVRLQELLNGRADVLYKLARVDAALGNRRAALGELDVFSRSGLTFADPAASPELASLKNSPAFQKMLSRLTAARQPVSSSKLFLTLPENDLIAEDIAYDPAGDRSYISSVRHRKIISIDKRGNTSVFVPEGQPDIWAILALGIDAKRRVLWASTAAMPESIGYNARDEGRSALLKYSLDTGKLLKRYDLPKDGKHALGDMTLSAAGDVFVSDGLGAVYMLHHERDALEILAGKGIFRSPQTPALSADGHKLLIPDYTRGISVMDLATKQVKLVGHPPELSLGGIDGMNLSGHTLIAIQNGTVPERLIRMTLDDSFSRIIDWKIIEANWPGLGDPTHGVVVGDQFYFIANSGWDRMADDGSVKPGATFEPATIRRMPVNPKP